MSSKSRTLYIGVTGNLPARVCQHRERRPGTFTGRYRITKLVYYEQSLDPRAAIAREKQLKGLSRQRKIDLVTGVNPAWDDLSEHPGFFLPTP